MAKDVDLDEFLINKKPCLFLTAVREMKEPYASAIAKEIDTTYAHALSIKDNLQSLGMLTAKEEGQGQKAILSLTEDGEGLADALENLIDVMDDVGENPE